MKIGVFAVLFGDKPFEETLDYLVELGVEAVEIGTGAYPGNAHCNPAALLASERKLRAFGEAVTSRGLVISALSCHGNPLHPQARIARDHHNTFLKTVELARALDVDTVITFSGCPRETREAASPRGSCRRGRLNSRRCWPGSGSSASRRTGRTPRAS